VTFGLIELCNMLNMSDESAMFSWIEGTSKVLFSVPKIEIQDVFTTSIR
jgi:hypothetical protein